MPHFGDQSNSDIIVRIITTEGRDDLLYCHSQILEAKSTYFEERLTCNLKPHCCFKIHCQEPDVNHYVQVLRLCYADVVESSDEILQHTVKNSLGILRIAVKLGCQHLISACVNYLEAVPWDDSEEDEILRTVSKLGPKAFPILARIEPVHHAGVKNVFISALRFTTSPSLLMMAHLKSCAKQQILYMLSKDHDDAPLLIASDQVKFEVDECTKGLFLRFHDLLDSCSHTDKATKILLIPSYLSDLLWFFKIVRKLGIMTLSYFIVSWLDMSDKAVKFFRVEKQSEETNFLLIKVAAKVLEAIGKGMVILPTSLRDYALKVWLPFIRWAKPLIETGLELNHNRKFWVSLESTFVTLTLSMPSIDQTQIFTEWLNGKSVEYPDLTQAFNTWCNKEEGGATQSLSSSMSSNDNEEDSQSDSSTPSNVIEEYAPTLSDCSSDN